MNSTDVINAIRKKCGKVRTFGNGWCHYVYRHLHYVNIPDEENKMIRMAVPFVANSNDLKKELVEAAVNETNRNVKYVKAVVLNNGSISLEYDQRVVNDDKASDIVPHMIDVLFVAYEYLTVKIRP